MEVVFINGIELLQDNERYYTITDWSEETYNNVTYKVPSLGKEINYSDIKFYIREKKLKRILNKDEI